MEIIYYPNNDEVSTAMNDDDPLLVLISYNGEKLIIAPIDESFEHHILLKQVGYSELDIDKYFRIVLNHSGADWTFVCPGDYKGIQNKDYRLKQFYNDGFSTIEKALTSIGYNVPLQIPKRYQRHFNMLGE